jgi:two-component system response regulator RpaA
MRKAGEHDGHALLKSVFTTGEVADICRLSQQTSIPLDRLETGKTRVLVVDDDPAIVEMLVELLERDGRFEVQTAATGFDAGLKTREFRPDVIVLDYMLPDINGNAVCRSIRSDESLRDVKIIIVSGVVNPADVDKLREDGADDFIQKPFIIEHVVNRITDLARA